MKQSRTYNEAMSRLDEIQSLVSDEKIDIDKLSQLLAEAQELIAFCKAQLTKAEDNVKEILSQND